MRFMPSWILGSLALVPLVSSQLALAQEEPVVSPDSQSWNAESDAEGEEIPTAPTAPPALPAESSRPNKPFAGAVWVSPHWFWDGSEWRLKPGTWIASMPGYQFVNGYWRDEGDRWTWMTGGWARAGSREVEIPVETEGAEALTAETAPPPPQQETPPPQPQVGVVWSPGYWYWAGASYVWIGGSWLSPPRPGLVYVRPSWVQRGPRWYFAGGGWAVRGSPRVVVPVYPHARVPVRWGHPYYFHHTWYRAPAFRRPMHYRSWAAHPNPGWHRGGGVRRGHRH